VLVWNVHKYRPIGACRSMAVRRGNRTRTFEAQHRAIKPTHTGTLVCMGKAPTHPRACVAQEPYLQVLPCLDLNIPDTWVPSEVHTPDNTHTNARAQQLGPARARMQRRVWARAIHTYAQRYLPRYTAMYHSRQKYR
jgi:hypothetical protein